MAETSQALDTSPSSGAVVPFAGGRDDDTALQVLSLALAGDVFAVETASVLTVLDVVPLAAVPNCRPFIKGLINVRGKVVPVVDLKIRLGIKAETETTQDSRIVVLSLDLGGEDSLVGILADQVYEVMELAPSTMEDTPPVGIGWRAEFIKSIGKSADGFIVLLDIERIFATADPADGDDR